MNKKSLFVALEGLDGSGKTSVARYIAGVLNTSKQSKVKLTYEPHDPSCGGLFIRQVLTKRITDFSPKVLALAFAANRLDHCAREIDPWLEGGDGRLVLCDRYYLSSLVYQSSDTMDFEEVYALNDAATRPDLIFFLNVSNEVCYERMKHRNQARELFETNLSQTREKFHQAMDFLRDEKGENIIEIDASGSIQKVAGTILSELYKMDSSLDPEQSLKASGMIPEKKNTTGLSSERRAILGDNQSYRAENAIAELRILGRLKSEKVEEGAIAREEGLTGPAAEKNVLGWLETKINNLSLDQLAGLFLGYIEEKNYTLKGKLSGTELDAFEIGYQLPEALPLRGIALIIPEAQRYDDILKLAPNIPNMSDFMFVFCPGPSELAIDYYERSILKYNADIIREGLFPSVKLITQRNLAQSIWLTANNDEKNRPR
ncbi:MAG: dTMP kinase [Pricia sp.]